MSSLCVLAAHGVDTIKSLFMEAYPEEGVIQCKFFKDNEWVFVVTDDRIPCGANGRPAFACCRDKNELWVPVLEKCYAKVHGSFEAIESGSIADGLVDLTGESSETLDIKKEDTLWNMLKFAIDEGYVMGCAASAPGASVEMETPLGILMLHAYGILKVYEIQGFRLCKIRNPWGRYEWKGKWSDGSKEWTPSLMKELNVTFEDDGTFFMEFSDFCKQFNKLYVLRILTDEIGTQWKRYEFKSEWAGPSAGGCPNFDTWSKNPQYHVRVPETSKVFVSLRQPCMRLKSKYKPTYPKALGFCVFVKGDSSPDPKVRRGPTDLVCLSPFFAGREISVEFEAKANVDYVIVPSHFKPGEENPFFIFIYTINPKAHVALCVSSGASQSTQGKESAPQQGAQAAPSAGGGGGGGGPKTEITLEAAWIKGKTAGGCINEPTWKQNPQFILELPTESKIAVTLKQTQKVDNKFLHCGFIILKADPQKKSKIQIVDNIHQSQYINSQSNTSDVSLSAGAYNIITTTFHPNLENTFTLSVAHDCDPKTTKFFLLTPQNDWAVQKASGAWGPGKDGGCSNNKATWMQNPQFLLQVDQKVSAKVVLEVNGPKSAVGFYLFTSNDGVKVVKMVGASAFMQGQKLVSVVKDYDLEPGKYILLAATFDPAKHSNFDVIVYADKPLSLRAI
uniref:Calpain catalytic domain-containing protein n=1 Tax=Arcella intermedia TaxID=1963864 RepID=A0A6B2KYH0_9EUKA